MKTFLEKYDELSEFRVISKAQRKKMGKTAGGHDFGHDYGATAAVRKKRQDDDYEAAMGRKPSPKKEEKKTTKEEVEVVDISALVKVLFTSFIK